MLDLKEIKNIHYQKGEEIIWSEFVLLIFRYFLFAIGLCFCVGVLSMIFEFENILSNIPLKVMFIRGVLIAPIAEESFFRLLLKPRLKNLIAFSVVMFPIMGYLLWTENYNVFTIIILVELFILLVIVRRKIYLFRLQRKFIKYFPFFFYFSILSFGFSHIFNFTFSKINFWIIFFSPVLVLPQIIMGSFLGYIRIKYGFIYSVLFHTLINGILTVFMVLKSLL